MKRTTRSGATTRPLQTSSTKAKEKQTEKRPMRRGGMNRIGRWAKLYRSRLQPI